MTKEHSSPNAESSEGTDLDLPHVDRVRKWGHRAYVGGSDAESWYGIGKRQYHFLVSNGLSPQHKFLDVACGSLRLGQYLIPMLDAGNYHGIEGEESLVQLGLKNELLFDIAGIKKPNFMFNYEFDVTECDGYDYAMAQSLFTHLTIPDIRKCFTNLFAVANASSKFFFTFFEGDESANPEGASHPQKNWHYRFSTLRGAAEDCGFELRYIGDWRHERGQMIAVASRSS
jgi:hypothetical protein